MPDLNTFICLIPIGVMMAILGGDNERARR